MAAAIKDDRWRGTIIHRAAVPAPPGVSARPKPGAVCHVATAAAGHWSRSIAQFAAQACPRIQVLMPTLDIGVRHAACAPAVRAHQNGQQDRDRPSQA
eukprot:14606870-Alexandrium_andersonii.AAC.1